MMKILKPEKDKIKKENTTKYVRNFLTSKTEINYNIIKDKMNRFKAIKQ